MGGHFCEKVLQFGESVLAYLPAVGKESGKVADLTDEHLVGMVVRPLCPRSQRTTLVRREPPSIRRNTTEADVDDA